MTIDINDRAAVEWLAELAASYFRDPNDKFAEIAEALRAQAKKIERLEFFRKNHRETLVSISHMNPATEADRMVQWAKDSLSGYTKPVEETLKAVQDERDALIAFRDRATDANDRAQQRIDDLTAERDALSALVVKKDEALEEVRTNGTYNGDDWIISPEVYGVILDALALTPDSLAGCVVVKREDAAEAKEMVERLRSPVSMGQHTTPISPLLNEAADLIERMAGLSEGRKG